MRITTAELAALTLLLMCRSQPLPGQTAAADADTSPGDTPRRYSISADETEILIRVFRAGALARLGHNHVISAKRVEGSVTLDSDGTRSSFLLRLPVEALEVDDPDSRRRAGDRFATEPSAADIAGTRENMLGSRVLDAGEYPTIMVRGTTDDAASPTAANVTFELKQASVEKVVPIRAQVSDQSISVTGTLELSHQELGLRPFRALAGALRVAERMEVSFAIHAVRDE